LPLCLKKNKCLRVINTYIINPTINRIYASVIIVETKLGLFSFSFTFSKSKDIIESENIIKKKTNAFSIPIFIIRENGLAFLFSKKSISDKKRNEMANNISKSVTSLYTISSLPENNSLNTSNAPEEPRKSLN